MRLYEFFKERESRGQALVLVTVFNTAGSTYSKAGGRMIIDADGNFCGMLSGGCLEGDLVERARQVIETGTAQTATYDLGADDELWGLGVGCDGSMNVLLQPLLPEEAYRPFAAIAEILNGGTPAVLATVIRSESAAIEAGASAIIRNGDMPAPGEEPAHSIVREWKDNASAGLRDIQTADGACSILYSPVMPSPALLVLGAGLDCEPVVKIACELGWRCTVTDHRPAYIDARALPDATAILSVPADEVNAHLDLDAFDMAIVMSHHLVSDRAYLQQLADSRVGYIGLLGPAGRRRRLMGDLGDLAAALEGRLHGPAGIELGGTGPAAIALEIVAGMQLYLSQRV